ncbi:hypothetical protein [Klebsiella pneumoniae]|nr:hypothetical protein [Klebsiella pneumoniae]
MLPADINDPVAKDTYINRVQTLTKEMASQVDFAVKRENHMRRTLDAAREFLGVEVFNKLYTQTHEKVISFKDKLKNVKQSLSEPVSQDVRSKNRIKFN